MEVAVWGMVGLDVLRVGDDGGLGVGEGGAKSRHVELLALIGE